MTLALLDDRTMSLGPFAGPIYVAVLIVDCLFFLWLEWCMPRQDMDFVQAHWKPEVFAQLAREAQQRDLGLNLTADPDLDITSPSRPELDVDT